jgi:hypothetical protein
MYPNSVSGEKYKIEVTSFKAAFFTSNNEHLTPYIKENGYDCRN